MTDRPFRVVKVGGSLFDLPDLPERLRKWLAVQETAQNVLIAGGGRFVDTLRQLNDSRPMNDETSHWLAIDLMDVAAHVLAAWMPDLPLLQDFSELSPNIWNTAESLSRAKPLIPKDLTRAKPATQKDLQTCEHGTRILQTETVKTCEHGTRMSQSETRILAPGNFLREVEPGLPGPKLPVGWDVTSDSIAARVAVLFDVAELVLLKSSSAPVAERNLTQAKPAAKRRASVSLAPVQAGHACYGTCAQGSQKISCKTLKGLSKAGYVDRFFPHIAQAIPCIRFENLRS